MNLFHITVLVAIVSFSYSAHILPGFGLSIMALLEEKCNKNEHNNEAFNDLKSVFEPLTDCFDRAMGTPSPHPLYQHEFFCKLSGNGDYYTCLNNFAKKISPCLDEDEAYFPNFVLTIFNASFAEYCGENGFQRVTAMISDVYSSNCLVSYLSSEVLENRCMNDFIMYKNIAKDVAIIRKNFLCRGLRSMKECIIEILQESCNGDHTETINFLIDPYLAAC